MLQKHAKTYCFTLISAPLIHNNTDFSKTHFFTMTYAQFFKNTSFYINLYTARLGAILGPFWHRAGPVAEQSRAEPSRAWPGRAEPSRADAMPSGPETEIRHFL